MKQCFRKIALCLMVALAVFNTEVQVFSSIPKIVSPQSGITRLKLYQNTYASYKARCPSSFKKYDLEKIIALIEHLEADDHSIIETYDEIRELGAFLCFLYAEGCDYQASDYETLMGPLSVLLVQPQDFDFATQYYRSDPNTTFSIPNFDLDQKSSSPEQFKSIFSNPHRVAIGSSWGHLTGVPILLNLKDNAFAQACKYTWDQARAFISSHKKEVLIGAAVVIGIIIIVTICMYCTPAVASEAAGGIALGAQAALDSKEQSQPLEGSAIPSLEDLHQDITAIVEQQSSKERDISPSVKEHISYFAHEALDSISDLTTYPAELLDEIKSIKNLSPQALASLSEGDENPFLMNSSTEALQDASEVCHEKIDDLFGTDYASVYNPNDWWDGYSAQEKQEALDLLKEIQPDIAELWLPPPGFRKAPIGKLKGKIPITKASNTRGWKVGDPINNLTKKGNVPSWRTVRERYWKNMARDLSEGRIVNTEFQCTERNIARMKKGRAPQRMTKAGKWESIELHHNPPQWDGGLFDFIEVWPQEHADLDPNRRLKK